MVPIIWCSDTNAMIAWAYLNCTRPSGPYLPLGLLPCTCTPVSAASTSHAPNRWSMLLTVGRVEARGGRESRVRWAGLLVGVEAALLDCLTIALAAALLANAERRWRTLDLLPVLSSGMQFMNWCKSTFYPQVISPALCLSFFSWCSSQTFKSSCFLDTISTKFCRCKFQTTNYSVLTFYITSFTAAIHHSFSAALYRWRHRIFGRRYRVTDRVGDHLRKLWFTTRGSHSWQAKQTSIVDNCKILLSKVFCRKMFSIQSSH